MMRSRGIMEVTVVAAKGLKNTELFGKMDPYVVIQYKNQEQKSTTGRRQASKSFMHCCVCLRGQGGNPVWNEKYKFSVEYKAGDEEQHKLLLKLMDRDNFTHDDDLGQATIYLKELFEQGVENGKAELRTQKYRVVSANKDYHGEIQVGVTFTTTEMFSPNIKMSRKMVPKTKISREVARWVRLIEDRDNSYTNQV